MYNKILGKVKIDYPYNLKRFKITKMGGVELFVSYRWYRISSGGKILKTIKIYFDLDEAEKKEMEWLTSW